MAFPIIGSLSQNTHFSLLYHLYHFDTVDQRHPVYVLWHFFILYQPKENSAEEELINDAMPISCFWRAMMM
jgi:hypothetical protein